MRESDIEIREGEPLIFATGVFLRPHKLITNGKEIWGWIACGFEDDSFYDGEICNPTEFAVNSEELLERIDHD